MPANLTPQYYEAEEAFRRARTKEEKMAALEEMLAVIPKHKGTEKLQADIKRRLAKLREQEEKRVGSRQDPFVVERQGAGQVVLMGFPNAGKSSLVAALTRARVAVADYPFSTPLPVPGMMPYEDIHIQLVDTPPVTEDQIPPGLAGTLRNADLIAVVIDASSDECLDQLTGCIGHLEERRILRDEVPEGVQAKTWDRLLVVGNKADVEGSEENLSVIRELLERELPILPVSAATGQNLAELRERIFRGLGIIRVYSKVPGKEPDMTAPFVLPRGATVLDMARAVHRDFPQRLKNARVWGSVRFDGQAVPRDYVLADRDIVELHV